jgi:hypothetical protein
MFACIAIFVHSILSHYSIAPRCRNRLATPEGYADCLVLHFLAVSRSSNLQVKESSYEKYLLFKRHFSIPLACGAQRGKMSCNVMGQHVYSNVVVYQLRLFSNDTAYERVQQIVISEGEEK